MSSSSLPKNPWNDVIPSPSLSFRAKRGICFSPLRANGLSMTGGLFQQPARRLLGALVLCLAISNIALAASSPEQMEQDIGYKVFCMCGCVTALNHCPHENCTVKSDMHKIIRTDLAEGKAEPAILQDLVSSYGEKVLASPP